MYWIRDITVTAGSKEFVSLGENALEIRFNIPFSNAEEPDVAEVTIYNLSDATIADIKKDGYLLVDAGYKEMGNKANIFTGEIEDVEVNWNGLDKEVRITATDGGKAWRTKAGSHTYKNGTKASQIMKDLAEDLGYEVVAIEPKNDIEYPLGKTVIGLASTSLRQIVKDTESKMFVNKNRIVIRPSEKGYETGFVLNADSGLVGSPTQKKDESGDKIDSTGREKDKKKNEETKQTWVVTSLLNPKFETDSVIKVESKALSGLCIVKNGRHTEEFNTEMEVEEL